jgi:hypothetical protein
MSYHSMCISHNSISFSNLTAQGQLQTEHSVDTSNYIMDKHNIKSKTNYRQALEENTLMQRSKQTKEQSSNNSIQFNYLLFNNNNNNNNNVVNTNLSCY